MIKGHKSEIEKTGAKVLDPQVISDAVVKQIFKCRGDQLVIAPMPTVISTLRSWPSWLSSIATRSIELKEPGI